MSLPCREERALYRLYRRGRSQRTPLCPARRRPNPATRGRRPHRLSGSLAQPVDRDETKVSQILSPIRRQHHPNHREAARHSAAADHHGL